MTFYLKYRPQNLDQILGQETIKQTLKKAFENNKLSHAYLFCGPRGVGKTSTARILAKMVNCEKVENVPKVSQVSKASDTFGTSDTSPTFPCNTCSSCISITDGSSLDLIEIDAASNRGIDDIRELRDKIKLAPSSSKKKIYIIDEVHMLTTEAFNALLKTLEEPPEHALFILATTEVNKIPQTILSRVQRFDFKHATESDLIEALKRVVKEEKIVADEEALRLIAKKSEGSFRDSLKILDQLSSAGEKITKESVEEVVRSGSFEVVIGLIKTLSEKDTKKALEIISTQEENGVNFKEFNNSVLDTLRSILLIKHNADKSIREGFSEEKFNSLKELADKLSLSEILRYLELFQTAFEKLKYVSIQALPMEIAVVESALSESVKSVESVQPVKSAIETVSIPSLRDQELAKQSPILEKVPNISAIAEESAIEISTKTDDALPQDMAKLLDKWNYILETIKPYNYSLEALLKQAKLVSCEESMVILEVPYSFHQRILDAPKSRNLLESVLTDVLEKPTKVSTKIGKRPVKVEELANVEPAADDEIIKVAAEIFNSDTVN